MVDGFDNRKMMGVYVVADGICKRIREGQSINKSVPKVISSVVISRGSFYNRQRSHSFNEYEAPRARDEMQKIAWTRVLKSVATSYLLLLQWKKSAPKNILLK